MPITRKSREWEKERRDKLNVGFSNLYKLLPDHDPSVSLSKMDILRKAAEYIRHLQDQNEEIVKSGKDDVLKNEAERLRKRVAYLVLKTKDLVGALKAAGVPIPNKKKNKYKNKIGTEKAVGKDPNCISFRTTVKPVQQISCGFVLANRRKLISGVSSAPVNASGSEKVVCGCDKAAKKNPLSEVNSTCSNSLLIPAVRSNVTVVACNSQSHATNLNGQNSSVLPTNIENTSLTSTLGAGTLIFRDGRVITVPPPSPLIPQILVKPQPSVIVMQKATHVAVKRDKFPLIFPKRGDITQTTYMNKAPIPAIKTFRLESLQKTSKPSKAKKKTDSKVESVSGELLSRLDVSGPGDQCGGVSNDVVTSFATLPTAVDFPRVIHSPLINLRKRKAEAVTKRGKLTKFDGSFAISSNNKKGEVMSETLQENAATIFSDNSKEASNEAGLDNSKKSPVNSCVDSSDTNIPVTCKDNDCTKARHEIVLETEAPERDESSIQQQAIVSGVGSRGETVGTSVEVIDIQAVEQRTLNSPLNSFGVNHLEKEDTRPLVSSGIPRVPPSLNGTSPESGPLLPLPAPTDVTRQEEINGSTEVLETETARNPKSQSNSGLSENVENKESKSFGDQGVCLSKAELFSGKDDHDLENHITKISIKFKQPESSILQKTDIEIYSETPESENEKTPEEKQEEHVTSVELAKLSSHPITSSFQEISSGKFAISDRSSMVRSVGCSVVNNQCDSISGSVNPEPMFSFDDSVHEQLDSYQNEISKTQPEACSVVCNNSSDVAEVLKISDLDLEKRDHLTRQRKCSKDVNDDDAGCSAATLHKPVTSSKISSSVGKELDIEKSNNHEIDGADGTLHRHVKPSFFKSNRSDDTNLHSTSNLIPGMGVHESTVNMRSFQSQAKVSLIDTVPSSAFTSGTQMYSVAMSEPSRTESFFNYDNPIATLPSADPFFSNFLGKTSDVGPMSYTTTPTTCFSYTNFTTQAPPVRSVARQLFPADPLCSIANSYNLLNSRQSELEANLPHLSAANTQMFQFSSYSSAGSYRDPVLFASDFVTTPTKTNTTTGTSENLSQNSKGTSALHPTHNYTDLLHSTTNMNNFPNISCNFSVATSSSSCIPTDFSPITSTQSKLSHITAESQPVLIGDQSKLNRKSCSSEANFSMNIITSSTASKSEMKTQGLYSVSESTVYQKSTNCESSQNLNLNYLHPASHTHPSHMTQDVSYNLYMRDPMPLSKNMSNHNTSSANHVTPLNSSVHLEKSSQKTTNHAGGSHKSLITKEFSMNNGPNSVALSVENTRDDAGRFSVQSNLFQNTCNQYPDHSSKARHGHTTAGSMLNFHGGGSSQLPSTHQSVQTQQSYLGNANGQQGSLITKNSNHIASSGNQSFGGSIQSSNRHNHLMQPDKYLRVSGSHCSMKLNGGHSLNDTDVTECTVPVHHAQESYQTVSSLVQNPTTMPLQNQAVFSSANVFSHPNFSAQHRSLQGPTFSSFSGGSSSINSQTIYTNPTTVVSSNQVYLQGANSSPAGAVHRGNSQNILSLNSLAKAIPAQNSQLPNPGNLPPSTRQFSTVESLAHNNHDVVCLNSKNQSSSSVGNQIHHTSQSQAATNPSNGNFSGTNPSQSINVSTNRKPSSIQNDRMSSVSMNNIANYSQNASLGNINNHHAIAKGIHSSGHNYNNVQTSTQNLAVNKSSSHYTPATTNHLSSTKQCDYPLTSILTGLNDSVLGGTSLNNNANSTHLNKNALLSGMTEKSSECREKAVDKQYSTNTEGNSFKTTDNSCGTVYLRSKDNERNSFVPIIEDVRLNSEFSNDLFSSLQVPTGGAHSDSTSPTAAFLLAFPLVSTSKNTENPHEQDPADNNTSTPTTILQIGNIEPPNSEIFHPLEFAKDLETSAYLGQDQDKCKRKENGSQEKHKKQATSNACPQTYNYPGISSDFSVGHFDQTWSDNPNKSKLITEGKKSEKTSKHFNNNSNTFEYCKQDKKKKNKISVNWMAAPDANDSYQKEVELSSFPTANLPFPMDIDGLTDLCSAKKNNSGIYSWSPSKSLLPIDSGLLIPSTLPTLVGDLALGTTTPSDPFSKRCDSKKTLDKELEKSQNPQKVQNNFHSVSQLVDPKSKKQKITENKFKKNEKKKAMTFTKRKDTNEPCMYPDNFLPPLGWDKYRYKNNYSAEALIGSQDINESVNFSYQQNANYLTGADFNQEHHPQSQQYQNSFSFSQNQFSSFVAEEYQNDNFSMNQLQGSSSKRMTGSDKRNERCRDEMTSRFVSNAGANSSRYHHSTAMQLYPPLPLPSTSTASSLSSNFTSNTTTSVTNFNLSTIFPEINERTGSQGQQSAVPQQQQNQQQQHIQQHSRNSMNSFSNSTNNNCYRPHNI